MDQSELLNLWAGIGTYCLNESSRCKTLSNDNYLFIIDYATTQYSSNIKEGMHISWQKPALNKYVDFLACLCVGKYGKYPDHCMGTYSCT